MQVLTPIQPTTIYDSRPGQDPADVGPKEPLRAGWPREIPVGHTAAEITVTVIGANVPGFVSISGNLDPLEPGDATIVNWAIPGVWTGSQLIELPEAKVWVSYGNATGEGTVDIKVAISAIGTDVIDEEARDGLVVVQADVAEIRNTVNLMQSSLANVAQLQAQLATMQASLSSLVQASSTNLAATNAALAALDARLDTLEATSVAPLVVAHTPEADVFGRWRV